MQAYLAAVLLSGGRTVRHLYVKSHHELMIIFTHPGVHPGHAISITHVTSIKWSGPGHIRHGQLESATRVTVGERWTLKSFPYASSCAAE